MNIAIARLGKSIRFKRKDIGKYAATGAGEARTLFITLAKLNPQNTYYIIGKSDFQRLEEEEIKELFPNNNVIDVWKDYKDLKDEIKNEDFVNYKMNGIKIDYGVLFGGVLSTSLPNKTRQKKDPTKFAKPMFCYYNYASPVVNYLNESKIPWIDVNTDTRYYPAPAEDLLNPEKVIVGMWDTELKVDRLKDFTSGEKITHTVKSLYSGVETLFLADEGKVEQDLELQKNRKGLTIFHNQGGGIDKTKTMKEYVVDSGLDYTAYGNWTSFPDNENFKGFLKFDDLHRELQSTKYTFMIAGNKITTATMKLWECIHYGVIPFLHCEYDKDRILETLGFPSFLRTESPEDFKEKLLYLENNPEEYEKIYNQLKTMLKEEYYTGEHINNEVNRALEIINNL